MEPGVASMTAFEQGFFAGLSVGLITAVILSVRLMYRAVSVLHGKVQK